MNSHPQPRRTLAAFTLIELLTVITIIAILMGLLFPAINIAKDQANKARAKADVTGIAAAVKAYFTEYGKYPVDSTLSAQPGGDIRYGNVAAESNVLLFDILTNVNRPPTTTPNPYNPRGIVYFEGKAASDPSAPRGGFVPTGVTAATYKEGAYLDPWGTEYRIVVDNNYDNQVIDLPYTDFNTTTLGPRTGVAVYSLGKDKNVGKLSPNGTGAYGGVAPNKYRDTATNTNSDDVISWQ